MKAWVSRCFSQLEGPSYRTDMAAAEFQYGIISHSESRYKEITPALFLLLKEKQALKYSVFFSAENSETQRQNPAAQLGHVEPKILDFAINGAPKTESALL